MGHSGGAAGFCRELFKHGRMDVHISNMEEVHVVAIWKTSTNTCHEVLLPVNAHIPGVRVCWRHHALEHDGQLKGLLPSPAGEGEVGLARLCQHMLPPHPPVRSVRGSGAKVLTFSGSGLANVAKPLASRSWVGAVAKRFSKGLARV